MGLERLPPSIAARCSLPLIAAPMLRVSGHELVVATCRSGVIGSFPVMNPSLIEPPETLDSWLKLMRQRLDPVATAPFCPNIIMRSDNITAQVETLIRFGTEMVITSVGSPKPVLPRLHDAGVVVLADVATIEHAKKAIDIGVDGLVLLTAGAGGQTGWLNPFAFVRAVRNMFDGIIVLAGGIADGASVFAAELLGCDLVYMGTKFIAAEESMASNAYRTALVNGTMDDIILTKAFTGLWANYMRSSIIDSGLDPDRLDETISEGQARDKFGTRASGPRRWTDVTSAGHSISGVGDIISAAQLIERTRNEYLAARSVAFASLNLQH